MNIVLKTPLTQEDVTKLKAGDNVAISGTIFTARDAAHKKITELLSARKELPFKLSGQLIYHVGPCPAKEGCIIGSCGPTTSSRMDTFTPKLIEIGLKGIIGKGDLSQEVIDCMKANKAIYFGAIGGAGALISKFIKSQKVIAFDELGTEAVRELIVENFPAVVLVDSQGNNLLKQGRLKYKQC